MAGRKRQYVLNVASWFIRSGAGLVVNLGLMAFLWRKLGTEGVGVWATGATIGGSLAILDLNLTSTIERHVAALAAKGRRKDLQMLLGAALRLMGGLTTAGAVVALCLSPLLARAFFKTAAYGYADLVLFVVISVISFALLQGGSIYNQFLSGLKRQDEVNMVGMSGLLVGAGLTAYFTQQGYPIWSLGVAGLAGNALNVGLVMARLRKHLPWLSLFSLRTGGGWIGEVWRFSAAGYLFNIWGWLYLSVPKLILANRLGPGYVAFLEAASKIAYVARNGMQVLSGYLIPFLAEIQATEGERRVHAMMQRALGYIWMTGVALVGYILLFRRPLLALWLGTVPSEVVLAAAWVTAEFTVVGLMVPLVHFAIAQGRFAHTRPFLAYMIPACVAAPALGLATGGFAGFLSWSFAANALGATLFYVVAFRDRGMSFTWLAGMASRVVAGAALAAAGSWWFASREAPIPALIAGGATWCVLAGLVWILFGLLEIRSAGSALGFLRGRGGDG